MTWTKPSPPFPSRLRLLYLFAVLTLCVSASFFALRELGSPLTGIDDANIYFVYARNLANGHGFVYNVGGERVEGFTSLLWTIMAALAFKFAAHPEFTLLIINILLVSLGIVYALADLLRLSPGAARSWQTELFWSALFLILIFTSPRYVVWNTITLMENGLWSTLLLITTIFVIQDRRSLRMTNVGFSLLAILLLLTRPEAILWVPVLTAVLFLRLTFASNPLQAGKALIPSAFGIALTLGLLTLFRLFYFGYPLPNTYYAKVSPSFTYNLEQGTLYLVRYFVSDPIAAISVIAIFATCAYFLVRRVPQDRYFFLPFVAAAGLLMPLLTGGDHFGSFRFYQNIYPISVLCLIYFFRRALPEMGKGLTVPRLAAQSKLILSVVLALALSYGFILSRSNAWAQLPSEIGNEFRVAEYERRNGTFIADLFSSRPRLPSIGVIASGGIKYAYPGEIVDLFGLNNTVMAHNHGDRMGYKNHAAFEIETFYQLQPDIVWPIHVNESSWEYSETELQERWENRLGFKGLFDDPRFLELYEYGKVSKRSNAGNGIALVAWIKKDFSRELTADANFDIVIYEYAP